MEVFTAMRRFMFMRVLMDACLIMHMSVDFMFMRSVVVAQPSRTQGGNEYGQSYEHGNAFPSEVTSVFMRRA